MNESIAQLRGLKKVKNVKQLEKLPSVKDLLKKKWIINGYWDLLNGFTTDFLYRVVLVLLSWCIKVNLLSPKITFQLEKSGELEIAKLMGELIL